MQFPGKHRRRLDMLVGVLSAARDTLDLGSVIDMIIAILYGYMYNII